MFNLFKTVREFLKKSTAGERAAEVRKESQTVKNSNPRTRKNKSSRPVNENTTQSVKPRKKSKKHHQRLQQRQQRKLLFLRYTQRHAHHKQHRLQRENRSFVEKDKITAEHNNTGYRIYTERGYNKTQEREIHTQGQPCRNDCKEHI